MSQADVNSKEFSGQDSKMGDKNKKMDNIGETGVGKQFTD